MTLREIVKQRNPERVNEICAGGVAGCPNDYPYIHTYQECCANIKYTKESRFDHCDECWSQIYNEGEQR